MKVLLISGSFPPMRCGIGDYTKHLSDALGKRPDVSVGVLTDGAARSHDPSPHVQVFPVAQGWKVSDVGPVLEAIRHFNPDIIHIQFPTQGYGRKKLPWFLSLLVRLKKIPVVQTWHEYYPMGGLMNLPNGIVTGGLVAVRPHYLEKMPFWFRWVNRRKIFRFIPNASPLPFASLTDEERRDIRARIAPPSRVPIAYFGFAYPAKNLEALFEVSDPSRHHLILICELNPTDKYHGIILQKARCEPWMKHVTVTGYLPGNEVARILAAVDAVVLPFRDGGGSWNTSLQGAISQGTFVLTTSRDDQGYNPSQNVYYAKPGDIGEMKYALETYVGRRNMCAPQDHMASWDFISNEHVCLYNTLLAMREQ